MRKEGGCPALALAAVVAADTARQWHQPIFFWPNATTTGS